MGMPRASHVCTVVADLDRVTRFYSDLMGVGPFDVREVDAPDASWGNVPAPGRWRVASAPFGQAEMEIIEVVDGRPPHRVFIDTHGEGMNHICWEMPDGDAYGEQMLKLGLEAGLWPYWGYPENGFAYVYSEELAGGVAIEVIRARRGFNHFGLAVNDTEGTARFYANAFGIEDYDNRLFPGRGFLYDNERIDATFQVAFTRMGETWLEFVQPIDGDTPFARQLASKGEGLNHLRLEVDDLDDAVARAQAADARPEWHAASLCRVQCDSRATGGMTVVLAGV